MKVPKSRSVTEEIERRIVEGALQAGDRLPSERSLSEELDVSRSSVQNALRQLEAMGVVLRQHNRRPLVLNVQAIKGAVAIQTSDQIAIWMLPDAQDLGGSMMLQGLRSAFAERNFRLLVASPPSYETNVLQRSEVEFFKSLLQNRSVAGVVVWDTCNPECHRIYEELIAQGTPIVFMDREPNISLNADLVAVNHRKAAAKAVNHLISLGHRQIGAVSNWDHASSVLDRIDGFYGALRDAGIDHGSSWQFEVNAGSGSRESAYDRLIERAVAKNDRFTALFAVNDQTALYLLDAAVRMGVSVPEDLSIVGFDWLMRWLPGGGSLTTVSQPFDEIGRTAAQRMLHRIGNACADSPRHILLDANLVIRSTTAPPNARVPQLASR